MHKLKSSQILLLSLLLATANAHAIAQSVLSPGFTYQGVLSENGEPVDGEVDIKFELYAAAAGGTRIGQPSFASGIGADRGLFTATVNELNEFGPTAFSGQERWLQVSVRRTEAPDFVAMDQRQRISLTPYAAYSASTRGIDISPNGNGGIGGAAQPAQKLYVIAQSGQEAAVRGESDSRGVLGVATGNGYGIVGTASGSGDGVFGDVYGTGVAVHGLARTPSGQAGLFEGRSHFIGEIGIKDTFSLAPPAAQLDIRRSQPDNFGILRLAFTGGDVGSTSEDAALFRVTSNSGFRPFMSLKNGQFLVTATGDLVSGGNAYIGYPASTSNSGFVSIGASGGEYGNIGFGYSFTGTSGQHTYRRNDYASRIEFRQGGFRFFSAPNGASGSAVPWTQVMVVGRDGNIGIGMDPTVKLDVAGRTRTHVLEITGGADVAEPFDVRGVEGDGLGEAIPGMTVVIDGAHEGGLRVSTAAYDRGVAGIVSGAGGIKPGLLLSQKGSAADGGSAVALCGRVYCWCEADSSSIAPGDLLVTSGVPGHAMKAQDGAQASGAVIGKAMSRLDSGRGVVLVLVSMQ